MLRLLKVAQKQKKKKRKKRKRKRRKKKEKKVVLNAYLRFNASHIETI